MDTELFDINYSMSPADEAVEETVEKEEPEEQEDEEVEEKEEKEEKKDDKDDDDEDDEKEESFSPEVKNVVKLLLNPDTRVQTIKSLAASEGIDLSTAKGKREIEEEIKELMGDELDQVPSRLWKAIDKIVERRVDAVKTDSKRELNEIRTSLVQKEASDASDKIVERYPDFPKFEKRVQKLMQEVKPAAGVSMYKHLKNLYHMAKGLDGDRDVTSKKTERINSNARDVNLRQTQGNDDSQVKRGVKAMDIDDAINAAFVESRKGKK